MDIGYSPIHIIALLKKQLIVYMKFKLLIKIY